MIIAASAHGVCVTKLFATGTPTLTSELATHSERKQCELVHKKDDKVDRLVEATLSVVWEMCVFDSVSH